MVWRRDKTLLVGALLILVAAVVATGQEAIAQDIRGKVEVRHGSTGWQPLEVGQRIAVGATISTGFGARAVLEVGETEITVQPLTRLTIEELISEQGTQQTDLFLGVGRVRANVRTGENTSHDFQLRSAVSTAAVRGTEFEYDGYSITGFVGLVVFESDEGFQQLVGQGDESSFNPGERPSSPRTERRRQSQADSTPDPQTQTQRRRQQQAPPPGRGNRNDDSPTDVTEELGPNATVGFEIQWPE